MTYSILSSQTRKKNLVAITFDISSFFDNLDHYKLKQAWKTVLQEAGELPDHHYAVFKNLTKFSYVEIDDLFDEFNDEILVRSKSGATIKQATENRITQRKRSGVFL